MLVILMDNQLIAPEQICQTCLLASQAGQPRWSNGQLRCGHAIQKLAKQQPDQYECEMGFRVANIE
ncbi:MAG TPA: hypothetical protein V6C46_05780 [Coleofasciculaceae cyanobacterium]